MELWKNNGIISHRKIIELWKNYRTMEPWTNYGTVDELWNRGQTMEPWMNYGTMYELWNHGWTMEPLKIHPIIERSFKQYIQAEICLIICKQTSRDLSYHFQTYKEKSVSLFVICQAEICVIICKLTSRYLTHHL